MNSETAAELVRQAGEAVKSGSYDSAVDLAQQALQIDAESSDAYSILGIAYSRLDRKDDAEEALRKVAQFRPDAAAHYNLAAHYYACGNLEYAANHARAALVFDSGHEAAAALLRSVDWESQAQPFRVPEPVESPKPFRFVADLGWSWTLLGCFLVGVYVTTRAILLVRFTDTAPTNRSSISEVEAVTWFFDSLTSNASLIVGAVVWLALMSAWWVIDNAHWRNPKVRSLVIIGMLDAAILMCCTYGLGLVVTFTFYLVLTRRPLPTA
jgi:tetratricopeptide (TPR) repeat protein